MDITIKRNGYKKGSVGWLAAGLDSGELQLSEAFTTTGHHALWLKGDESFSQFLGAHNRYGLTLSEYSKADQYEPASEDDRDPVLTEACWASIMDIAQQWCDQCNESRDNDISEIAFSVARKEPDQ